MEVGGKLSYQDRASSSRVAINIFIKQSSGKSIFNLCTWMWNFTRWRAASLPSTFLNIGKFWSQSTLGILFGKPGMWSWLMGSYLLAIRFILKMSKLLISLQWSHHEALIAGFFSEWSREVNDFILLMSDCCSPSTIRSDLDMCTGAINKLDVTFTS